MSDPTKKHPYPSDHRPGSFWATDAAWEILDALPVGALTDDQRFITGGRIAGALLRVAGSSPTATWRVERELLFKLMGAASHALKSYAFGNTATDLADEIAEQLDRTIAAGRKP